MHGSVRGSRKSDASERRRSPREPELRLDACKYASSARCSPPTSTTLDDARLVVALVTMLLACSRVSLERKALLADEHDARLVVVLVTVLLACSRVRINDSNVLTPPTNPSRVTAVSDLYLFTWNLCQKVDAHELAVDHLAEQASNNRLFIACFQELPGESAIAQARKRKDDQLEQRGLRVVQSTRSIPGAALVHHPSLRVSEESVFADEDGEFMTAIFQLPSAPITVGIVNLHATSRATVPNEIDRAGCRALLRQAINERRLEADHIVIIGDWNSEPHKDELNAYHTFYALPSSKTPQTRESWEKRRGLEHPPFHVRRPHDPHGRGGTYLHTPPQNNQCAEYCLYDFIAFRDKKSFSIQEPQILTQLVAKDVWNDAEQRPCVSDHLPVEAFLAL